MATVYQARDPVAPFRAAQATKVSVGGKSIPGAAIAREMQCHEAPSPLAAWQSAARALAVREMLVQEARRLSLMPRPQTDPAGRRETDAEALIGAVIETEVRTPEPDEQACRRYYERNLARFRSVDLFEAAHILIAARRDERPAMATAREAARWICAIVAASPEAFAELAAAHSACPSAGVGGNLGQIKRGDTTPEFEAALEQLQPGETTREPIETRYGVHVIRLDRRIAGRTLPFELVAERIAGFLSEKSRRAAIAQYLARLASRSDIVGVEFPTPADLRVY